MFQAHVGSSLGVGGPDACIDSITASEYFNRAEVMAAIHVKKPEERWATCGSAPGWNYESTRKNLPRDTCECATASLLRRRRETSRPACELCSPVSLICFASVAGRPSSSWKWKM